MAAVLVAVGRAALEIAGAGEAAGGRRDGQFAERESEERSGEIRDRERMNLAAPGRIETEVLGTDFRKHRHGAGTRPAVGDDLEFERLQRNVMLKIQVDRAGSRGQIHDDAAAVLEEHVTGVAVPGIAWAVNITPDGRMAIAGSADGTLRWYRLNDGAELLALFPHADGQRWVLWTPQGYYQASVGGEDLIGWHLNRGLDTAPEFYGASRFREQFYRPDVIARVLTTLDSN